MGNTTIHRRQFLERLALMAPLAAWPTWALGLLEDDDALICARKFEIAVQKSLATQPIGEVIIEIGRSFIGTEYLAHALEVPGEERLIVNMRGLDCVSFCENVLVLARCIKKGGMTFEDYKNELQFIRYRGGVIDRYPSRLHYFTDYIYDNELKRVWKNVTKEIGGEPYRKKINFMSTHPELYRQLREHPEFVDVIRKQEEEITKRDHFFVSKVNLQKHVHALKNGDMLAITTSIAGLDVSHTGIAVWQNGNLHMMHAPDVGYNVMITKDPLVDYLMRNRKQTGVIIARAVGA
jgi:hypothetical protein